MLDDQGNLMEFLSSNRERKSWGSLGKFTYNIITVI